MDKSDDEACLDDVDCYTTAVLCDRKSPKISTDADDNVVTGLLRCCSQQTIQSTEPTVALGSFLKRSASDAGRGAVLFYLSVLRANVYLSVHSTARLLAHTVQHSHQ